MEVADVLAGEVFGEVSEIGESTLVVCIMIVLISRYVVNLHVFFIFKIPACLWLVSCETCT